MYKFFLTVRYIRTRLIALFSMLAIALAVGMVLVVYSVMSGFLAEVERNTQRISGDLIIEAGGLSSIPYYDEFIAAALADMPDDITAMTPVVFGYGLLKMLHEGGIENDRTEGVEIFGVRLSDYARVTPFAESLFYESHYPGTTTFAEAPMPTWWLDADGKRRLPEPFEGAFERHCAKRPGATECSEDRRFSFSDLDLGPGKFTGARLGQPDPGHRGEPRPGAVLGIDLVVSREGDAVYRLFPKGTSLNLTLLVPTRRGQVSPDSGRTATMRYVDDSYTRVFQLDSRVVYCDFDWLQDMLDLDAKPLVDGSGAAPPRASRIHVKLSDGANPAWVCARLRNHVGALMARVGDGLSEADRLQMERLQIMTWDERHADVIAPVRKERVLMLALFGLISGVAVMVVGCVFYMIVQDRSREIGIVKSMGATSRGVAGIFVVYAVAMGLAGSVVGAAAGSCFVWKINEIQDWLASKNPALRVWSPEIFAFDRIPNTVDAVDAACIIAVAIVASMFASGAAAWRAARVWPVDAIRYE